MTERPADGPGMAAFDRLRAEGDLWERLSAETRPIWLYGTGNGADKLLDALAARGIPAAGVFASDAFARDRSFHGFPVRARSAVLRALPPEGAVALLAFGTSRPAVLADIAETGARLTLLVPDFPVCPGPRFDLAFARAHREALTAARAFLADADSRALFDRIVLARLTGRLADLDRAVSRAQPADFLRAAAPRRAADLGAYTGDSARELFDMLPVEFLLAAEPDPRSFRKLAAFAAGLPAGRMVCRPVAVSDRAGAAPFDASGGRSAGLSTGRANCVVPTDTLDRLLDGRPVDFIKYDVEGAEAAALRGSAETIRACRPLLRVACYHRSEDLFALPLLLHALAPTHALFLTRPAGYPLWDIDLIAFPHHLMSKIQQTEKGECT